MAIFTETENNPGQEPARSREELEHDLNLAHESYQRLNRELQITLTRLGISESKRRNQRKQLRSYQKLWSMYVKGTHDGLFNPEPDQTA